MGNILGDLDTKEMRGRASFLRLGRFQGSTLENLQKNVPFQKPIQDFG